MIGPGLTATNDRTGRDRGLKFRAIWAVHAVFWGPANDFHNNAYNMGGYM